MFHWYRATASTESASVSRLYPESLSRERLLHRAA
jgi:hypothetical protein